MAQQQVKDADKAMYRPGYQPSPDVPSWFTARLRAVGGQTLDGRDKVRVVWGMDAKGFPNADPEAPKYVSPNDALSGWACFMLEQFVGPEFFGAPDEWERNRFAWVEGRSVEVMAPYPGRGEYVLVQPLATPDGEPLPLSEQVADYVAMLVKTMLERPPVTPGAAMRARMDRLAEAREERRRETEEALERAYDDAASKAEAKNRAATREWGKNLLAPAAGLRQTAERLSGTQGATPDE